MQNNRIDISELARKALGFEAAFVGKSLKDVASEAILRGVSEKSLELAKSVLVVVETPSGSAEMLVKIPPNLQKMDIDFQEEPISRSIPEGTQVFEEHDHEHTDEGPINRDIAVQKEITYKSPFDPATEELIRHGCSEGMTGAAIARQIGKPKSTVNKWIAAQKEMGKL